MAEQLLVGGRWIDGSERGRFDVDDPATGERITTVADATPADAADGVAAALCHCMIGSFPTR